MALQLGNTNIKEIYLGNTKIAQMYLGSTKVYEVVDPYNPLNLPPNTVRVVTPNNQPPSRGPGAVATYETATLVPGTTNVYDVYKSGNDFTKLLNYSNIVGVLGANTTGITNMESMFERCIKLTSVPLFDTSKVTDMSLMFERCIKLTSVPLFDTSKVTNMSGMFAYCYAVESGALVLYQQASTQANPPTYHAQTFTDCGNDTTTGAAELAQIPRSWGGTGE